MANNKILVICGPTATGKTSFALGLARVLPVELISADSRQVYIGMDIITGKDVPQGFTLKHSRLRWRDRYLNYFSDGNTRIWLQNIVFPNEPFNVSFWKECADLAIADIHKRNRLPVIVGGTGLYLKALSQPLSLISIPPNQALRRGLQHKTAGSLFNYLSRINPSKAANLNSSDRKNPRRLVRAIEISLNQTKNHQTPAPTYQFLSLGLSALQKELYSRIDKRVKDRVNHGAQVEVVRLTYQGNDWNLPSMTASGYPAWKGHLENTYSLDEVEHRWKSAEHAYVRRQITWFKKQPEIIWFNVSEPNWQKKAETEVINWYN